MARPDDVPEDVWRAAVAVTSRQPTAFGWRKITEDVAKAILAERERCAAEADDLHAGEFVDEAYAEGYFTALDLVGAAIRKGGE